MKNHNSLGINYFYHDEVVEVKFILEIYLEKRRLHPGHAIYSAYAEHIANYLVNSILHTTIDLTKKFE